MKSLVNSAALFGSSLAAPYVYFRSGSVRLWINRLLATPELVRRFSDPANLIAPTSAPLLKTKKPRPNLVVSLSIPEHSRQLVIKRYQSTGFWESLRPSRARRAFKRAFLLDQVGIPTAVAVAAIEWRVKRRRRQSFLITEAVHDSTTFKEARHAAPNTLYARRLIRELASFVAAMHARSLGHSDLSHRNVLVQKRGEQPTMSLIDLDSLVVSRRMKKTVAFRDLRGLFRKTPMSQRERLWFCAQYCHSSGSFFTARELHQRLTDA